jgi:phosphoglycerate-specific signal transduction histidine kinase
MANSANLEDVRLAKEALLGRLLPNLIHQLRNPLNSILTSAELLDEQGENGRLRSTLLPVVSRSAVRIRDILSSLDSSVETNVGRSFELREALSRAQEFLQCRRHTVAIHAAGPGTDIVIGGEYEPLWILLLSVLEETLCAAKNAMWIEFTAGDEQVEVSLTHDGDTEEANNSGFVREFILALAPALGGGVYYDALAKTTVLSLATTLRRFPEVQE